HTCSRRATRSPGSADLVGMGRRVVRARAPGRRPRPAPPPPGGSIAAAPAGPTRRRGCGRRDLAEEPLPVVGRGRGGGPASPPGSRRPCRQGATTVRGGGPRLHG